MHDDDREVNVKVSWLENGTIVHTWVPKEAGSNGKVKVKANDGAELEETVFFY
jgi:hypothetical protein